MIIQQNVHCLLNLNDYSITEKKMLQFCKNIEKELYSEQNGCKTTKAQRNGKREAWKREGMRKERNPGKEQIAYGIGWCVAGALAVLYFAVEYLGAKPWKWLPPCLFHQITGYYCPGCGITRAIIALLHGDFAASFWYHPVVLYGVVVGGWFLLSQTVEKISRHRIRIGMQPREIYLWIALAVILLQTVIKNVALLVFHTDLLEYAVCCGLL